MTQPHRIRIATRESRLALWQAEHVASLLRNAHPGLQVELVPMTTQGDRILDRTLAQVGGKGLFIKELEVAIAEHRADIAVHSMKDVPSEMPEGMTLAVMLQRADPRDAFLSNRYDSFATLPLGAHVGTSSLRRQCQLLAARPDLRVSALRGNVDTRLRKLDEGQYDAIILAAAGLLRLGLDARIRHYLDLDVSLPAVGQGIIGIEARSDDAHNLALVQALHDADAVHCCEAERAFAAQLQGSCQSPIAGFAEIVAPQTLRLRGVVGSIDGQTIFRDEIIGSVAQRQQLGHELASRLLHQGADRLLAELREGTQ